MFPMHYAGLPQILESRRGMMKRLVNRGPFLCPLNQASRVYSDYPVGAAFQMGSFSMKSLNIKEKMGLLSRF